MIDRMTPDALLADVSESCRKIVEFSLERNYHGARNYAMYAGECLKELDRRAEYGEFPSSTTPPKDTP